MMRILARTLKLESLEVTMKSLKWSFLTKQREVIRKTRLLISALGGDRSIVLDLGCGAGEFQWALENSARSIQSVGIDPNLSMLKQGKRFSVNLIRAVGEYLPLRSSIFDGVFVNEVLEHVNDEDQTLDEIRRVLRPGCTLYLATPNRFSPFDQHGMRIGRAHVPNLLRCGMPFLSWMPSFVRERVANARIYDIKVLTKLLSNHSFKVLKIGFVMPPLDNLQVSEPVKDSISAILKKLEHTIFLQSFAFSIEILAIKSIRK